MGKQSVHKIPRGIAQSPEHHLYVVAEQGTIHCLDLPTGKLLARTSFAAQPLTAIATTLIGWHWTPAESHTIQLFASQVRDGNFHQIWAQVLTLPTWVAISAEEPSDFMIEAVVEESRLLIQWTAQMRYRGGAPPPAHLEAAALQNERHQIVLDADSGAILAATILPPAKAIDQSILMPTPYQLVPYRQGTDWATDPWATATGHAWLSHTADGVGIDLVRFINDTNRSQRTTLTKDNAAIALLTPDHRYLLINSQNSDRSLWQLFEADSGALLARLPLAAGITEAAVIENWLLYLSTEEIGAMRQETLGCCMVDSAQVRWSYPLVAAVRRGPPPLRP